MPPFADQVKKGAGVRTMAALTLGLFVHGTQIAPVLAACTGAEVGTTPCVEPKARASNGRVNKASDATSANAKQPIPDTMPEVIAYAVAINPQVAAARSRLNEATAGIGVAEANRKFQLSATVSTGYGSLSTTQTQLGSDLINNQNLKPAYRNELSVSGTKLIWDFGSTDLGIDRAVSLKDSERFNLAAQIEQTAHSVADAYIQVFEARELSKLNKENIEALEKIEELVKANQENGNGTLADVKRVEARLVDARSVSADTEADLQNAIDRFRRLVKSEPGDLKPALNLSSSAPVSAPIAIAAMPKSSPHLKSIDASIRAGRQELASKKAGLMPQILLQTNSTLKAYVGQSDWNNLDASAMLTLSYKILDGGLAESQLSQISSRIDQDERRYDYDRDEAEANLRQLYNSIEAARGKAQSLAEGVAASQKARELYTEQFRGGKRTLFELLDIQTAYFNAVRSQIMNEFEERKSVYAVLQTLGIFATSATRKQVDPLVTGAITPAGGRVVFPAPLVQWTRPNEDRR